MHAVLQLLPVYIKLFLLHMVLLLLLLLLLLVVVGSLLPS